MLLSPTFLGHSYWPQVENSIGSFQEVINHLFLNNFLVFDEVIFDKVNVS
jgi:hypothetical protein